MSQRDLLSTRECADILGVRSTDYVVGEIREGRLRAAVRHRRPSGRTLYLVDPLDLRDYCQQWSDGALERMPA